MTRMKWTAAPRHNEGVSRPRDQFFRGKGSVERESHAYFQEPIGFEKTILELGRSEKAKLLSHSLSA